MIVGLGTDIVENKRIKRAIDKWGEKFLTKVYTEREVSYCLLKKDPVIHLAGRFAAKEATIKALTGVKRYFIKTNKDELIELININWRLKDIEILNNKFHEPCISIFNRTYKTIPLSLYLSISHDKEYSIATVVIEHII
ncbi:MAG: holo-ACP synthase [Thermodesulfovibrionales bacterium]|nr:holo-ACP synthase [Thermodesulfovibrionales bacterium]